ncbi:hypothetical protein B0T14DRAFT_521054 [Immersiella caudata]|uniref:Uncharacterized protein n=1 Tax=Immersiella caudata TaxID=314043 RepID=A0AA39WS24_9PEZI|nr:hypothetical protein B0T14DRAFT_521054 [Immersiella caudata]
MVSQVPETVQEVLAGPRSAATVTRHERVPSAEVCGAASPQGCLRIFDRRETSSGPGPPRGRISVSMGFSTIFAFFVSIMIALQCWTSQIKV